MSNLIKNPTARIGLLLPILLVLLIFSCQKENASDVSKNIEWLSYDGDDPFVLNVINQVKPLSLDVSCQSCKAAWDKRIHYGNSADSLMHVLIAIADKEQKLTGYLSISLSKDYRVSKAAYTDFKKDFLESKDTLSKLHNGRELLMLQKKGFKPAAIVSQKELFKLKVLRPRKNNYARDADWCLVTGNIYYEYDPLCIDGFSINAKLKQEILTAIDQAIGNSDLYEVLDFPGSFSVYYDPTMAVDLSSIMLNAWLSMQNYYFWCDFELGDIYSDAMCPSDGGGGDGPVEVTDPSDPCSHLAKVNAMLSNSYVAAKLADAWGHASSSYEWGGEVYYTDWTNPSTLRATNIRTNNSTNSFDEQFFWQSGVYCISGIHTHPTSSAPSLDDIFYMMERAETTSFGGDPEKQFYLNNASTIVVGENAQWVVTVSNWAALRTLYTQWQSNKSGWDAYYTSRTNALGSGTQALLEIFGASINVFVAAPDDTYFAPAAIVNGALAFLPC